jgi:hypothetical protein
MGGGGVPNPFTLSSKENIAFKCTQETEVGVILRSVQTVGVCSKKRSGAVTVTFIHKNYSAPPGIAFVDPTTINQGPLKTYAIHLPLK